MPRAHEPHPEAMARLYEEQGFLERAAEIYAELLLVDGHNVDLQRRLAAVEAAIAVRAGTTAISGTSSTGPLSSPTAPLPASEPTQPRVSHEPFGLLDLEELPEAYGEEACEVLFRDPHQLFTYWEITPEALRRAREDLGADGGSARLVLRVFITAAGGRGTVRETRDHPLDGLRGRRYLPTPRPGVLVRAAAGLVAHSGLFIPLAQSSTIRIPPAEPAPPGRVDWVEVPPLPPAARAATAIEVLRSGLAGAHQERPLPVPRAAEATPTSPPGLVAEAAAPGGGGPTSPSVQVAPSSPTGPSWQRGGK